MDAPCQSFPTFRAQHRCGGGVVVSGLIIRAVWCQILSQSDGKRTDYFKHPSNRSALVGSLGFGRIGCIVYVHSGLWGEKNVQPRFGTANGGSMEYPVMADDPWRRCHGWQGS